MLKTMCAEGGVGGIKTNHSLRATGATEMFQANVPEKIIQQRTGHRSHEALRTYERTTADQHRAVSTLLSSSSQSTYQQLTHTTQQSQLNVHNQIATQGTAGTQVNFQNVTGCTINVYQQPPSTTDI